MFAHFIKISSFWPNWKIILFSSLHILENFVKKNAFCANMDQLSVIFKCMILETVKHFLLHIKKKL